MEGHNISFVCQVTGFPLPIVTWLFATSTEESVITSGK